MFETFDHTADIGLRVAAGTLEELFVEAAHGLTAMLVENTDDVRSTVEESVSLTARELDYLLFDWLNELLFRFDTRQMLFREFSVRVSHAGLDATVRGELCDRSRHRLAHEVKAITYHGLCVEQTEQGWRAEMILDI